MTIINHYYCTFLVLVVNVLLMRPQKKSKQHFIKVNPKYWFMLCFDNNVL